MHWLLVNGELLSHDSFILPSECTAHNYASDLSGTRSANILSGNKLQTYSHTHTHTHKTNSHAWKSINLPNVTVYSVVYLLQDCTIISCQLWVGKNSHNTAERKSSVKHILCPPYRKFCRRVHSKNVTTRHTFIASENLSVLWNLALRKCQNLTPRLD